MIFITFGVAKIMICIFFMFSPSRDWVDLGYVALVFAVISLVLTTFFLPESPRFLVGQQKYEEALKILSQIQNVNGYSKRAFVLK